MPRGDQLGIALLRIMVGAVFVAHGAQKLFVIGVGGVSHMLHGLGIPMAYPMAIVVTLVEFGGGIALILGVATRYAAALLVINMAVAVFKVHLHNGFFLNKGGFEYALTLLVANLALLLAGPGSPSLQKR